MANILRFVILGDDRGGPAFASFTKQVEKANASVDRNNAALKRQSATAKESRGGILALAGTITGFGDAADAASSRGNKFKLALAGINLATGVLEPALAGVVVAAGGAAAAFASAGIGAGVFGAVAGGVFAKAKAAADNFTKAQDALNKATTSAQRQKALAGQKAAFQGLNASQVQLAKGILSVKDQWGKFIDAASPGVVKPAVAAMGLLPRVFQIMKPFLAPVEKALTGIIGEIRKGIAPGSAFSKIMKDFAAHSGTTLKLALETVGHLFMGLIGVLHTFMPAGQGILVWAEKASEKFQKWGLTLKDHTGFQSLMQTFRTETPLALQVLKNLGTVLLNVGKAMTGLAGVGNSKSLLQVLLSLSGAASSLSAHPALVRALLYLTLVGKGAGQIKGVFDSLKSGWNTMAGVISALTGGKIQLGMQSAGDTMLLASRNMQRAADTMVGAGAGGGAAGKAGGAAGAAGGLAGILGKLRIPSMAAAGGLIAAGIVLKVRQDLASGLQGIIRDVPKWFNFGTLGFLSQSASGWATLIVERVKAPFRSGMAWIGHFIAASWDQSRAQTVRVWGGITGFLAGSWSKLRGTAASWFGNIARTVAGWWASMRSGAALWWRNIAATVSAWWGNIRSSTARSVASVAGTIAAWWRNIRAGAGTWWHSITSTISSWWTRIIFGAIGAGQNILAGLRNGIASGMRGIGGWLNRNVVQPIIGAVKHFFGVRSPSTVFAGIGSHLVGGLVKGITSSAAGMSNLVGKVFGSMPKALLHIVEKGLIGIGNLPGKALNALKGLGSGILKGAQSVFNFLFGGSSGALGGDAAANKALARRMFPWPASMFPAFDYLEMREAGYNRFARNPSSGAYGIPQALPPSKMPFAAQAGGGSHAGAQLAWMFGYIRQRYGNPVNAAAHERSANWYGYGGLFGANQLIGVGDRGPELVTFGRGGRVFSPEQSAALAGGTVSINVTVDPAVAAADRNLGRNIANHLAAHLAAGGHIYRPRGI